MNIPFIKTIAILQTWVLIILTNCALAFPQADSMNMDGDRPLVAIGNANITFTFEHFGKPTKIEMIKSCFYYEWENDEGDKRVYGKWYADNHVADYISNEGWGLRIDFGMSQCPYEEKILFDWSFDHTQIDRSEILRNASQKNSEGIRIMPSDFAEIYYLNNVTKPTLVELHNEKLRPFYKTYSYLSNSSAVRAKNITIEFSAVKLEDKVLASVEQELDKLHEILNRRTGLTYLRLLALPEKEWGRNKELSSLLNNIDEPTILEPSFEQFSHLYERKTITSSYPAQVPDENGEKYYNFVDLYPMLIDNEYWDVRQFSLSRQMHDIGWKRYVDGKVKTAQLGQDGPSKIKAGDYIFDLKNYKIFLKDENSNRKTLWFYDPKTKILTGFKNFEA